MKNKTRSLAFLLCLVFAFSLALAACQPTTYTVSYANGNNDATGNAPATQSYEEGATVTVANNTFALAGHKFEGWSDGSATYKEGDTFTMPAKNVTLTAQWSKNEEPKQSYTVTYVSGNQSATGTAPAEQSYHEGDTVTVAANTFELSNHQFAGWSDGSALYQAGETFAMPAANVTLTAQWKLKILTIAEVLDIIGTEPSEPLSDRVYVAGTVKSIDNPTYGQMTLEDETGRIMVYGTYSADGKLRYSELDEKPYAGDYVLLYAELQNFNGTPEIKSGWIVEFKHVEVEKDLSKYTEMSIDEARSKDTGALVILEGVVAQITYANGRIPSGFYLVDDTNSIYVYDSQLAPQVSIGNKVKLGASRTNWILDSETSNAAKFGYTGCIQVENAILISNDKGDNNIDYRWVAESTVKKIMDTPITTNITTTIYKVNALVKKAIEPGFVNYYIDDLDGHTGSYVYTQCNGSDFAWLDEFDGKICTVYLSVINAKSTASGCVWRLLPIQVSYDNFKFDESQAPKFAIDYHGVDQFKSVYQSDPALELVTKVDSELLGFEGVTLSYSSNNESVVYFATEGGATILHTGETGKATVTITASYKTFSADATVEIEVKEEVHYDALTVAEAIAATVDQVVIARGIVGPSLVNQQGFYLIDDTGVIAVKTEQSVVQELTLGDEVVVQGTRTNFSTSATFHGQTCLLDSQILINYYGHNEYSTKSFVKGKTLEDIAALPVLEDHTTTVYVLNVTIDKVEQTHFTNYYVKSGDLKILLYSGNGKTQYAFLEAYAGQDVTVEFAPVNWNKKTSYAGCVLAVYDANGNKVVNQLNFSNKI